MPRVGSRRREQRPNITTALIPPAYTEAEELLVVHGRNELEEKTTPSWLIFVQQVSAKPTKGP